MAPSQPTAVSAWVKQARSSPEAGGGVGSVGRAALTSLAGPASGGAVVWARLGCKHVDFNARLGHGIGQHPSWEGTVPVHEPCERAQKKGRGEGRQVRRRATWRAGGRTCSDGRRRAADQQKTAGKQHRRVILVRRTQRIATDSSRHAATCATTFPPSKKVIWNLHCDKRKRNEGVRGAICVQLAGRAQTLE